MKTLLRGIHRKAGFTFLALAIVLTCVWGISTAGSVYIARSWGEWQYRFLSFGDKFTVWQYRTADSTPYNAFSVDVGGSVKKKHWLAEFRKALIDKATGCPEGDGVHLRFDPEYEEKPTIKAPTNVRTATISYWMLVLPITTIAGVLILRKPRARPSIMINPSLAIG